MSFCFQVSERPFGTRDLGLHTLIEISLCLPLLAINVRYYVCSIAVGHEVFAEQQEVVNVCRAKRIALKYRVIHALLH